MPWPRANDEDAADIVWEVGTEMVGRGRGATLARWCAWFSDEAVADVPAQVALARGWLALEAGDSGDRLALRQRASSFWRLADARRSPTARRSRPWG